MKSVKFIIQALLLFILIFSIAEPTFAELNVEVSPTSANVGDTVTITVSASNDALVDWYPVIIVAPIPEGLQYISHVVPDKQRQDYDPSSGVWDVNRMRHDERGHLKVLIITTKVSPEAAGKEIRASAWFETLVIEPIGLDIAGQQPRARADVLTIPPSPTPIADFTATPTTGKAPLTVKFTDQSRGTVTAWLWDFGDGSASTSQNPVHVYDKPGNYTVTLTAMNSTGQDPETKPNYITVTGDPGDDGEKGNHGNNIGIVNGSGNNLIDAMKNLTASSENNPLSNLQKGGGGNNKAYEIEVPPTQNDPFSLYILAALLIIGLIAIGYFYGIKNKR